ncbi:MAG TPA: hypothetical protein VM534_10855 [Thermoanaerobaculia bacterium]|nr:hypothetical protein [Thermoanaerobaculia bacterium]
MRRLGLAVIIAVFFLPLASPARGGEVWIPIAGSVVGSGGEFFRTNLRVLNPSGTDSIIVTPTFFPINQNNSGVAPASPFTVNPREMKAFDDAVGALFSTTGLGAIRLVSENDFHATAQIYTDSLCTAPPDSVGGTFGQFSPGTLVGDALLKGAILHLRSDAQARANIGFANPHASSTTVTLYLYGSANTVLGSREITLLPFGVLGPTNVRVLFNNSSLSEQFAWVSFVADQTVIGYGSVADEGSADQYFVPAVVDTGEAPVSQTRTFEVTAQQWSFSIQEDGATVQSMNVQKGATVVIKVRSIDVTHGFSLERYAPGSLTMVGGAGFQTVGPFVADEEGEFSYFCTNPGCGEGHFTMVDTFTVGSGGGGPGGPGY